VVFCADDDFLFPDPVCRCVEFLENAPGFASAMGRIAMLNVNRPHQRCGVLKGYSIEDDRPFDRCRQMAAQWFSNAYAVYRTETLLDILQTTAANTDSGLTYYLPEMLASQLSVMRGGVKVLPLMYSLREYHAANAGTGKLVPEDRSQTEALYQRFRECLVNQLEQTGIARTDAEQFVDGSYGYLRDPVRANQRRRRRRTVVELVRQLAKGMIALPMDYFSADLMNRRRFLRASDLAGCEANWQAAVQLIREFPSGMPSDHSTLRRCA
jgi:hypothetical protein